MRQHPLHEANTASPNHAPPPPTGAVGARLLWLRMVGAPGGPSVKKDGGTGVGSQGRGRFNSVLDPNPRGMSGGGGGSGGGGFKQTSAFFVGIVESPTAKMTRSRHLERSQVVGGPLAKWGIWEQQKEIQWPCRTVYAYMRSIYPPPSEEQHGTANGQTGLGTTTNVSSNTPHHRRGTYNRHCGRHTTEPAKAPNEHCTPQAYPLIRVGLGVWKGGGGVSTGPPPRGAAYTDRPSPRDRNCAGHGTPSTADSEVPRGAGAGWVRRGEWGKG